MTELAAPSPVCDPGFVLLFSVSLAPGFRGFPARPDGFEPMPEEAASALTSWREAAQAHVLGTAFIQAARLALHSVGRIELATMDPDAPKHADVALLTHVSGVALWEVWMPAPRQGFGPARWVQWLDPEQPASPAACIWARLVRLNLSISGRAEYGGYLPLSVIRLPTIELDGWLDAHAEQTVSLLWRDRIGRPLKPAAVAEELARDTCARVGGITLLGRRGALDLQHRRDEGSAEARALALPPRSVLAYLISLELLSIERAVLQGLYDRLTHAAPRSIAGLLTLKQEVMDGLEEYYGATLASTRFNDVVAEQGEAMLGIVDLFDAVRDRLDMVSFAITTSYQRRTTALQFWLTVVFGATEIGFIAASIATWYYPSGLGVVLGWTLGASVISGGLLAAVLRDKIR